MEVKEEVDEVSSVLSQHPNQVRSNFLHCNFIKFKITVSCVPVNSSQNISSKFM